MAALKSFFVSLYFSYLGIQVSALKTANCLEHIFNLEHRLSAMVITTPLDSYYSTNEHVVIIRHLRFLYNKSIQLFVSCVIDYLIGPGDHQEPLWDVRFLATLRSTFCSDG
ncbi:hypothetical protein F4777DRAFT_423360 [Nemania sp. FL0916]|nr:hypothetical protein F4777DRAFT_423360 [Nemania sp. FL0916]